MANYKDYLMASVPSAAWMLDSSDTTDPDLSLNGLDALVSVADKSSVPIVSGADRAYTLNESSDTVHYPSLNIWAAGESGVTFSIEFIISPEKNDSEVILFAPIDGSQIVPNNQISLNNNKLSFIISDDTSLSSYTKRYEAYTFLDFTGGTYHCVATYEPSSISLFVNNELVSTIDIDQGFQWMHTQSTPYGFISYGSSGSSVSLSAVSIHKSSISEKIITSRYRSLMYRESPEDIVLSNSGRLFKINDSDRKKAFYFKDPLMSRWGEARLDNLKVIDNRLTLDKIETPELNVDAPIFKSDVINTELVRNGSMQQGNGENWTLYGTYDPTTTFESHGTIKVLNQGWANIFTDDEVPIDPTKKYTVTISSKADSTTGLAYWGLSCIDRDHLTIQPRYVYWLANTTTTLASPLVSGNTTVTLASTANWNNGSNSAYRYIGIWNYVDGGGYAWPTETYTRNIVPGVGSADSYPQGGISGNVITLNVAYSGPTIPAGTPVSNMASAGTYKYTTGSGVANSTSWRESSLTLEGIDTTGKYVYNKFPYGTTYAKPLVLNLTNPTGWYWIGDASITLETTTSSTHLDLKNTQSLLIKDSNRFLSRGTGALGTYVKFTAARHGSAFSGEYSILAISNPNKTSIIQVLEKPDKRIYLRYTSNGISAGDVLLASPAHPYNTDSNNYLYIEYSQTSVTAYWNDQVTTATIGINSASGLSSPQFDTGSFVLLGSSINLDSYWGSQFWNTNLWDSPKDIIDIGTFKDEVYQYTLKLQSDLNVSQKGSASWDLDTGLGEDGGVVNQSRVWWSPSIPSEQLLVETGVSGIQSSIPDETIQDETVYFDDYRDSYGTKGSGFIETENMIEILGAGAGEDLPETISLRATLSTNDSINDIVYLKQIGVDIFEDSTISVENGQDEMVFNSKPSIYYSSENIGIQELYTGSLISSPESSSYIYSRFSGGPNENNILVPETSDLSAPSTEVSSAKTVEFWAKMRPASSGVIFINNGLSKHSLKYDGTTKTFSVQGFDELYIDGSNNPLILGSVGPLDQYFNNKWHMIDLVIRDAIAQDDTTMFPVALGSPITITDTSKYYYGLKSFKITSTGSSDYIELYGGLSNINTLEGQRNTLSFFVYPASGVTSINTNYKINSIDNIVTHTVVPETWNLIERPCYNNTSITTLSLRVGTTGSANTIWIDGASLVRGADSSIKLYQNEGDMASTWFGLNPVDLGIQEGSFYLQNVALYSRSLTPNDIISNYESYIGNLSVSLTTSNGSNLIPATGYSLTDPSNIFNRNPDNPSNPQLSEGELLFNSNPLFLSSSWEVISST